MHDVEGAALTVAAVARQIGVAPATLRTWARRYGVGPSAHAAGTHRRYTPEDVARLEVMRRLTLQGVAPGDAAKVALSPGTARPMTPPVDGRGYHGHVFAMPDAEPAARGLSRAALALDAPAAAEIVHTHLAAHGVVATWEHLLVPVLTGVGERWQASGIGVEVEHLLSEVVIGALGPPGTSFEPLNARPVLLACAPEEQHTLPIHALAAALAERRIGSRVLGGRVPVDALASAVRRCGPSVVFVWAQLPGAAQRASLQSLPALRPPYTLVLAGPGWDVDPSDPSVGPSSLHEAVGAVMRAIGGATGPLG
jgi:MerR family transcriptional regulator, light-induced transcriptional regulator